MTSDTESIYSRFRARVDDNELAGQDEEIANEILGAYLKSVIAQTYIRKLFTNINFDEDVGEVEYDMREPIDDLADQEFTEELLALGMVVQWVSPRFHSTLNTAQFFSNSDLKFYSQANHMDELREMYNKSQIDLRKYIRDRGYANSYISGVQS